jgi:hypothetical protein
MTDILCIDCHHSFDAVTLRSHVAQDGVVLARNILTTDEIFQLRTIIAKRLKIDGRRYNLGSVQPNAAAHVAGLEFILTHSAIAVLFKALLGHGNVTFTGHSDIQKNMLSDWHKDSGKEGNYFLGDCFRDHDCQVYKIGFYLQDDANGLMVRPGSQRTPSATAGKPMKAQTRAGDAVIFDVRLSHCGQTPDLIERLFKAINAVTRSHDGQDSRLISGIQRCYWRLRGRSERLAMFFTFGAPNAQTRVFAEANMARQQAQAGSDVGLPPSLCETLKAHGIRVAFELPLI